MEQDLLGIACGYELLKNGITPIFYEKENVLGGLLKYGIPDFRLDKKIVDRIFNILKEYGAEFKTGFELGKNLSIKDLKEKYDYIFLGIGAEVSTTYKLSDEKLENVYTSDEFLRHYNNGNFLNNLGDVVVIGGGNTAMDSARAALRMHANKVSILYRRNREYMPARKIELDECLEEGITFKELTRVISANSENGKIKSVHCINTKIVDKKAVDSVGEFDYKANTVVFAIGLKPNIKMLNSEGIELEDWGQIKVDENNQTSIKGVYAGGDVVDNKSVVVRAAASGRKSALSIIESLK